MHEALFCVGQAPSQSEVRKNACVSPPGPVRRGAPVHPRKIKLALGANSQTPLAPLTPLTRSLADSLTYEDLPHRRYRLRRPPRGQGPRIGGRRSPLPYPQILEPRQSRGDQGQDLRRRPRGSRTNKESPGRLRCRRSRRRRLPPVDSRSCSHVPCQCRRHPRVAPPRSRSRRSPLRLHVLRRHHALPHRRHCHQRGHARLDRRHGRPLQALQISR